MSHPHHLLPWYFNGTLDPEETRLFEAHLPGCGACRRELALLEELQRDLDSHSADLFGDHPDPEVLLAAMEPEQADLRLEAAHREEVLRHAALCSTCTEEAGWLRGESRALAGGEPVAQESRQPARGPIPQLPRAGGPKLRRGIAWLGWAVAAAALAALLLLPPREPGASPGSFTGIVTPVVIRSTERGQAGPATIPVPSGRPFLHILFEVDAGADAFPLALEVTGPDGEPVFRAAGLERPSLVGGAGVDFVCERAVCSDGAYRARITTSLPDAPEISYSFRVVTGPPQR